MPDKNAMLPTPAVLIVDDETELREVLIAMLAPLKCAIVEAENGLAALQLIKTRPFDVVLSDLKMPHLSGLDMLEMARMYGFKGPVIMITGYGRKQDAIDAMKFGAFDFIDKPFTPERVQTAVREALQVSAEMSQQPASATAGGGAAVLISRNLQQAVAAYMTPTDKKKSV